MNPKVLITDRYTPSTAIELKTRFGCDVRFSKTVHPTAEELKDIEILLIRSRTRVDRDLFHKAPQLKLIVTATAGFDHIDWRGKPTSLKIAHAPEAHTNSVVELTFLFLLALERQLQRAQSAARDRQWRNGLSTGGELAGLDLGLLGFGRIGQEVARRAKLFGMTVYAYDPYQPIELFKNLGVTSLGYNELLAQSDILSIHAPLTKETRHMINGSTIELMSSDSRIINTARGGIINENDLIEALQTDQIAGAALDVFENEPLKTDSRLHSLPNVILTPHIGAYTEPALIRASIAAVSRVAEFLSGQTLNAELPPPTAWAVHLQGAE